jgi:hypothetical protein
MLAPIASGLVEETWIGIGQEALDIGGGSGEPSLTISGIVVPTGSAMYHGSCIRYDGDRSGGRSQLLQIRSALPFPVSWLEFWKMLTLKMSPNAS